MDTQTLKWMRDMLESVKVSIIGRVQSGTLKNRDQVMISEMIGNILESASEGAQGQTISGLYDSLEKIQITLGCKLGEKDMEDLKKEVGTAEKKLTEAERNSYIADALQLDVLAVMPLLEQVRQKQEEVRQSFQKAVDIDYKVYGSIDELTANALEAYHFTLSPDRQVLAVNEIKDPPADKQKKAELLQEQPEAESRGQAEPDKPEPDKLPDRPKQEEPGKEAAQSAPELEKNAPEQEKTPQKGERQYLHILTKDREEFDHTIKYLKENGGRFDPEAGAWHIAPGKLTSEVRKEYKIGEYIELPRMGKEQFQKTISFLKENGARFDKKKECWYLLPESDREKMMNYLSVQKGERQSVMTKLYKNKEKLEHEEKTENKDGQKESGKQQQNTKDETVIR